MNTLLLLLLTAIAIPHASLPAAQAVSLPPPASENEEPWHAQLRTIDTQLRELVVQIHDLRKKLYVPEGEHSEPMSEEESAEESKKIRDLEQKLRSLLMERQQLLQMHLPMNPAEEE